MMSHITRKSIGVTTTFWVFVLRLGILALLGMEQSICASTVDQQFHQAQTAFGLGDYQTALKFTQLVLKQNPKSLPGKILLAQCHARRKDYKTSASIFNGIKPLKLSPSFAFEYGLTFYHLGQCAKVRPALRLVQSKSRDFAESRIYLGICLLKAHEWAQAELALTSVNNLPSNLEEKRISALASVRRGLNQKLLVPTHRNQQNLRTKSTKVEERDLEADDEFSIDSNEVNAELGQKSTFTTYQNQGQATSTTQYFEGEASTTHPFIERESQSFFAGVKVNARQEVDRIKGHQYEDFENLLPQGGMIVTQEQFAEARLGQLYKQFLMTSIGAQVAQGKISAPIPESFSELKLFGVGKIHQEDSTMSLTLAQLRKTTSTGLGILTNSMELDWTYIASQYSYQLTSTWSKSSQIIPQEQVQMTLDDFIGEILALKTNLKRNWNHRELLAELHYTHYFQNIIGGSKLGEEAHLGGLVKGSLTSSWGGIWFLDAGYDHLFSYRLLATSTVLNTADDVLVITEGDLASIEGGYSHPLLSFLYLDLSLKYQNASWQPVADAFQASVAAQTPATTIDSAIVLRAEATF